MSVVFRSAETATITQKSELNYRRQVQARHMLLRLGEVDVAGAEQNYNICLYWWPTGIKVFDDVGLRRACRDDVRLPVRLLVIGTKSNDTMLQQVVKRNLASSREAFNQDGTNGGPVIEHLGTKHHAQVLAGTPIDSPDTR